MTGSAASEAVKLGSLRVTTLSATQPREARASASFATAPSGIYAVIVAVFCGLLLISNIAATKTITVVDGLPAFVGGGMSHCSPSSCRFRSALYQDEAPIAQGFPAIERFLPPC